MLSGWCPAGQVRSLKRPGLGTEATVKVAADFGSSGHPSVESDAEAVTDFGGGRRVRHSRPGLVRVRRHCAAGGRPAASRSLEGARRALRGSGADGASAHDTDKPAASPRPPSPRTLAGRTPGRSAGSTPGSPDRRVRGYEPRRLPRGSTTRGEFRPTAQSPAACAPAHRRAVDRAPPYPHSFEESRFRQAVTARPTHKRRNSSGDELCGDSNGVPGMWSGNQLPCTGTTGINNGL